MHNAQSTPDILDPDKVNQKNIKLLSKPPPKHPRKYESNTNEEQNQKTTTKLANIQLYLIMALWVLSIVNLFYFAILLLLVPFPSLFP